jgi:replicative DNA helicase
MEIHPFCKECLKNHPKWKVIKDKVWMINDAGRQTIQICNLIKEEIDLPASAKKQFSDEELGMIGLLYDPLRWSEVEFKWSARWYQETMLKCSAYRKVNRIGRRAGKTETLCIKMVHYAYTTENTTSLVIAPYKNQVGLIFDRLDVLLSESPGVRSSIKRNTKNPYRIQFHNGSKILGFTSGTRTGSKSTGIRGQDAHAIFLDEADYLGEGDFEVILAILASRPDCQLWASSTPTGKREMYWRWCTDDMLGFKEFHYPSSVSPLWTKETEMLERSMYSDQGYAHEFDAEFGEEAEGVFLNKYIDPLLKKYTLGKISKNPESMYTIGVDWNTSETGTHIIVTEWNQDLNHGNGAFRAVDKIIIAQTEFTQTKACEKIIELNEKWDPVAIYVDQGFGYAQIEMLHKYGLANPKTGLVQKVKGINFGDRIEIRDPATRKRVKKHVKPFMVNLCVKRVEDGHVILPYAEDIKHGLVGQMRDYTVIRRTATGQPIFRDEDDHTLVAWMLSIMAATMERSDMVRLNTVPHVAIGGKFGEKLGSDFILNRKRKEEEKRENSAIVPRWPGESKNLFSKDTTLKGTLETQRDRQRFTKKKNATLSDLRRRRQGTGKKGRASY